MTTTDQTSWAGSIPAGDSPGPSNPDQSGGNRLIPGNTIAHGRIRLLICHGGPRHLQFWQAADTGTGKQLAVTLVDPEGELPPSTVDGILSRTARLRGFDMPGLAKVIEVARDGCGVVISEWIRGATLKEVADTHPAPVGVSDAVQFLTDTAEAADRAGLALSIDHPARVRVSVDRRVVLAFPATMPDATPRDDLRGIGATMYGLLVNRWPLEGAGAEWEPVDRDAAGRVKEPAELNGRIPFLISATAAGLVRAGSGISSAETASTLLREASEEAMKAESLLATRELPALPQPGRYAGFGNFGAEERAESARRQILKVFLGTAAVVVAVLLTTFSSAISRMAGSGDVDVAYDADKLGLQSPLPTTPSPSPSGRWAEADRLLSEVGLLPPAPQAPTAPPPSVLPAPSVSPPPGTGTVPVKPVRASVFSPAGSPDNPTKAGLSIDGDPATAWSTDTYFDAEPFPKFKDGVGLLLELPQPMRPSTVAVDLSSAGTVVQLRSSPTPTPAKLSDTTELSRPTPLRPGHNTIDVTNPVPTTNLLIWITTLGNSDGKSRCDISEIRVQAVNAP